MPYYDKVEEYGDLNHRDVWEYELNLTREEVDRVIRHTWELQNIYSDYYFFTENCSYNALFLLEAGRPTLRLTDQFKRWVIPVDTVKAIEKAGLFSRTAYRPSSATKIKYLISLLDAERKRTVHEVVSEAITPDEMLIRYTNRQDQIIMLDLAAEYIQYLYTERSKAADEYATLFLLKTLRREARWVLPKNEYLTCRNPLTRRTAMGSIK